MGITNAMVAFSTVYGAGIAAWVADAVFAPGGGSLSDLISGGFFKVAPAANSIGHALHRSTHAGSTFYNSIQTKRTSSSVSGCPSFVAPKSFNAHTGKDAFASLSGFSVRESFGLSFVKPTSSWR